jgi:hypothetical protein
MGQFCQEEISDKYDAYARNDGTDSKNGQKDIEIKESTPKTSFRMDSFSS